MKLPEEPPPPHVEEALKASIPVSLAGATVFGMSLPDWAALLACIYTVLLIIEKAYNWWKRRRSIQRTLHGPN